MKIVSIAFIAVLIGSLGTAALISPEQKRPVPSDYAVALTEQCLPIGHGFPEIRIHRDGLLKIV